MDDVRTDKKTGLRQYGWNGKWLLSATSLRSVLGLSYPLHNWVLSQVVDAAVETGRGVMDDAQYKKALWAASRAKRDEAAELGKQVHGLVEQGYSASSLTDEDVRKPFMVQYEAARSDLRFDKELLNETRVFNLTEGYAGTFDSVYEDAFGKRWLVDLKTGKGIYPDHAIQLALYESCEFVGDTTDDGVQVEIGRDTDIFKSVEGVGVLHVRPNEWSFHEVPMSPELTAAAHDMARIARWLFTNQTFEQAAARKDDN